MSIPIPLSTIFLAGTVAIALQAVWRYQQKVTKNAGTPGMKLIISNTRQIMAIMPVFKIPFTRDWMFNIGLSWWGNHNYDIFEKYGQDIISAVSVDGAPLCYLLADAEAIQEVLVNRTRFPKPIETYKILELFGRNLVTTEGDDWKVHRKITAPSFSEKSNKMVCEETVTAMEGLFELWKGQKSVVCSDFTETTIKLALIVICGAGFGMRVPMLAQDVPPGHEMSFKSAVELVSDGIQIKVTLPDFAMKLTKYTARVSAGFAELRKYMVEMIQDRANSYQNYNDLFSSLLAANAHDSEGLKLTDDEVIGNIFIFLIAGHETTAHTLAFAAALLALYPDVQEKLYEFICTHVSNPSGAPTYNEVPQLTYVSAVFNETLRLYPPVTLMPKTSAEDTTLRTVTTKGTPVTVPIPKGSILHLISSALHTNPRYWAEPNEFKPERFLGNWPKHAFIPFSGGARSCIGRRFAEIEGVVALSMLIRNYRVTITDDPRFAGETFEERKARLFKMHIVITQTPESIPVTFTRRT
ncbi:hypothetical protein M408DRAFT_194729 [Serendipita vermifera MAFF 305830]|uniref:Cytochrome P450 n=2 Tax=Serendipita vermifera MAFF 305830 TaxID=933852 RepID=A0A0C3ANX0_SERVB|nr:hypothetical protein M408DRAFT_194729 [Serendipita vermifera MAFF 305830]